MNQHNSTGGTGMELKLPRHFIDDCLACDCDVGLEVGRTKAHVTLQCSDDQMTELRSRAAHYSTEWRYMGREFMGLGRSAAATLKAIDKQA